MDNQRFDTLAMVLGASGSRRRAFKLLAGGAIGAVLLRFGVDDAAAFNELCRSLGRSCSRDRDCCSRRCRRGTRRCPAGTNQINTSTCQSDIDGTCPTDAKINFCRNTAFTCGINALTSNCACFSTKEGGTFCSDGLPPTTGACNQPGQFGCQSSADCPSGAACVYLGTFCGCDGHVNEYGCVEPCV